MIELVISGIILLILIVLMLICYRIVPPSEAHLIVGPTGKMVCSSDKQIATNVKNVPEKGTLKLCKKLPRIISIDAHKLPITAAFSHLSFFVTEMSLFILLLK